MSSHFPRFLNFLDLPGSPNFLFNFAHFNILSRFQLRLHTLANYSIHALLLHNFTVLIVIIRSITQLRCVTLFVSAIVPKHDTVNAVDVFAFYLRGGLLSCAL